MNHGSSQIVTVFLVSTAIILVLIVMVAFFVVIYQRRVMAQKLHLQEIQADAQRQKLAVMVETQENERMRIARDLHDEVGALLSTAKMSLKQSERRLAPHNLPTDTFESTFGMLDSAIASVRSISHDLLPPSLESLGLAASLRSYCQQSYQHTHIPFEFSLLGQPQRLPVRTELAIFRVIQELLANSIKHAQASQRWLQLRFEAQYVELHFKDDGKGCDLQAIRKEAAGLGLQGMESRVESLGGSIQMVSEMGTGFEATIMIGLGAKA